MVYVHEVSNTIDAVNDMEVFDLAKLYEYKLQLREFLHIAKDDSDPTMVGYVKHAIQCFKDIIFKKWEQTGQQIYTLYESSRDDGNFVLNISEPIFNDDIVKLLAKRFRKCGVKEFTFSNDSSGVIETIHQFETIGHCKLEGTTSITCKNTDLEMEATGERYSIKPALFFKVLDRDDPEDED